MSYFTDRFITVGYEAEVYNNGVNYSHVQWQDLLDRNGYGWVHAKYEATNGVDVEFVLPPFCPHSYLAKADIAALFDFITDHGGKVGRVGCGGHIHVGNTAWRMSDFDNDVNEHWRQSKQSFRLEGRPYLSNPNADGVDFTTAMPLALVKDVIKRYAMHQDDINAILARSRRNNRFCPPITAIADRASDRWDNATTISDMNSILGGKFSAVSVDTWARVGTIEFRQHQATLDSTKLFNWCRLIANMFYYSDAYRIVYDGNVEIETPSNPYRNGSRIGVMWQMMRVDGGATTRDLMSATGWTQDTIRARVSEMRSSHGQNAVICHTQQNYDHAYGSSNGQHDLNGYEVPRTITTQARSATIRSDDDCGITSIWADLSDEVFEYFNARRQALT